MSLIRRTFTPSYVRYRQQGQPELMNVDSPEAYEAAVREGSKMKDSPRRLEQGFRHIQVRGGRRQLDATIEAPLISPESGHRLARQGPSWDRRTQSTNTPRTEATTLANLEVRIARAIQTYRATSPAGRYGLLVPDTPGSLITAGIPPRAARVLVARARGKMYLAGDVRRRAPLTLEQQVYQATQSGLVVRFSGVARSLELEKRGVLRGVGFRLPNGGARSILTEEELLGRGYDIWSKTIRQREGEYLPSDDATWFAKLWKKAEGRIRALLPTKDAEGIVLLRLTRARPGGQETEIVEVPWPLRSTPFDVSALPGKGQRLQDVGIDQLPRVLARISRRKPRSKALETPVGRKNSNMDEMFWLEQFSDAPFGGTASLPSARRNVSALGNMAGRGGMHGMYQEAGDPEMVKLTNAQLKAAAPKKTAFGAAAREELARRKRVRGERAQAPQPKSRKTERSRKLRATKVRKQNRAVEVEEVIAPVRATRAGGSRKTGGMTKKQIVAAQASQMVKEGLADNFIDACRMIRDAEKSGTKPKSRSRAKANTWHPDFTHTREALVPMSWSRQNRARANSDLNLDSAGALWLDHWDPRFEDAKGQFGVSEAWTAGLQPITRANGPKRNKKGQFVKNRRR